ncbi:MAG: hypothetical protein R2710_02085 [Acidimicrobiales bacterium]
MIVIRLATSSWIHEAVEASGTGWRLWCPAARRAQGSEWAGIQAAASLGHDGASVLLHDAARPFHDRLDRIIDGCRCRRNHSDHSDRCTAHRPDGSDRGGRRPHARADPAGLPPRIAARTSIPEPRPTGAGVDTAETMQHYGAAAARWVAGDERNIKVTHPDDRDVAEELARRFVDGVVRPGLTTEPEPGALSSTERSVERFDGGAVAARRLARRCISRVVAGRRSAAAPPINGVVGPVAVASALRVLRSSGGSVRAWKEITVPWSIPAAGSNSAPHEAMASDAGSMSSA